MCEKRTEVALALPTTPVNERQCSMKANHHYGNPLLNPLRTVLTSFACNECGRFDSVGAGPKGRPDRIHLCYKCREDKEIF
eukprot:symbB.v1.2.039196.t1/scaffold6379.1/size18568/2